jgi:hypothetical protein
MMSRIKALLCAAAAGVLGLGPVSPAHAATSTKNSVEYLELYDNAWYEGVGWGRKDSDYNFSFWRNDEASSARNNTSVAWVLYDDTYFEDRRFCILPHQEVPDLGAPAYKFNDKISSVEKLATGSCAGYPTF